MATYLFVGKDPKNLSSTRKPKGCVICDVSGREDVLQRLGRGLARASEGEAFLGPRGTGIVTAGYQIVDEATGEVQWQRFYEVCVNPKHPKFGAAMGWEYAPAPGKDPYILVHREHPDTKAPSVEVGGRIISLNKHVIACLLAGLAGKPVAFKVEDDDLGLVRGGYQQERMERMTQQRRPNEVRVPIRQANAKSVSLAAH